MVLMGVLDEAEFVRSVQHPPYLAGSDGGSVACFASEPEEPVVGRHKYRTRRAKSDDHVLIDGEFINTTSELIERGGHPCIFGNDLGGGLDLFSRSKHCVGYSPATVAACSGFGGDSKGDTFIERAANDCAFAVS